MGVILINLWYCIFMKMDSNQTHIKIAKSRTASTGSIPANDLAYQIIISSQK